MKRAELKKWYQVVGAGGGVRRLVRAGGGRVDLSERAIKGPLAPRPLGLLKFGQLRFG